MPSFSHIKVNKTAIAPALGDLESLTGEGSYASSVASSNTAQATKRQIEGEGCLITGTKRYSHEAAHIIDSLHGDSDTKEEMVRHAMRQRVFRTEF